MHKLNYLRKVIIGSSNYSLHPKAYKNTRSIPNYKIIKVLHYILWHFFTDPRFFLHIPNFVSNINLYLLRLRYSLGLKREKTLYPCKGKRMASF